MIFRFSNSFKVFFKFFTPFALSLSGVLKIGEYVTKSTFLSSADFNSSKL